MKNQYYGDSRDVAKWTVLVRLARMHALSSTIQIAMLTPDDRSKHGGQRDDPADADTDVRRFFAEERAFFARNPGWRSITRARRLAESMNPPLSIEAIDERFRHGNRGAYFGNIINRLSGFGRSTVAFLDPDVGIATARATEKHVTTGELRQVWETLNRGSVLVVFQFEQRQMGWREKAANLFAEALRISPRDITSFPYRRVSFLSVLKAGTRRGCS